MKKLLHKNKILLTLLFILICWFQTKAQDSLQSINAEQILQLVKKFHPVVRQTNITIEASNSELRNARGAFDPIINSYLTKKTFDGTNYYNQFSPEIRIPTWYGIEVSTGLENLTGNRLDPTLTTGQTSYFGVTVPLAKNLILDKRRAFLQQAKIFKTMAFTEQRVMVNDLLMDAMDAYWQWVKAYQIYLIIKNNVTINEKRLTLVKKAYFNGERPAIDTIEALTQFQSFQFRQNESWLEFQNAGLELSTYLWKTNQEPYLLPENVVPQDGWDNETNISTLNLQLMDLLSVAEKNHPALQLYRYKLDVLTIDRKLKFQDLLPKIDFRYNQLGKGYDLLKTTTAGPLFENNFQYGLKFEMPIRWNAARGAFKQAKLKIETTALDQNQKQLEIQVKVKSYFNTLMNLKNQIALQSVTYENFKKLVKAEETRFFNGESSLFLINTRENKALESLEKLIALKTKYFKTIYALQWSAGLLQ